MFLKVQLPWNVVIPAESLDMKGLILQKSIVIRLLEDFASRKATKDLGYYLALTTLESVGEGKVRQQTGDVLFPVVFSAVTFKLFRGEIAEGVVHKVLKHGVFLSCGPVENMYLSKMKMPDYNYVPGENPCLFITTTTGLRLKYHMFSMNLLPAVKFDEHCTMYHAPHLPSQDLELVSQFISPLLHNGDPHNVRFVICFYSLINDLESFNISQKYW